MDPKHRVYYLVNLNQNHTRSGWWTIGWDNHGMKYDRNWRRLKRDVPSIKVRPVSDVNRVFRYFQMMVSCRWEDEQLLLSTLDDMADVNYEKLRGE